MSTQRIATFTALGLLPLLAAAATPETLEAFPDAEAGMVRFVIPLPEMPRADENYSVELVAGRVIQTDGVNRLRMDTTLEAKPLEGWGYTFYEMTGTGNVASTLMAPPPDAEPVDAFVGGTPLTIRYNSRLPVVVYAPEGFEVRYRIWAAAEEHISAREG